jgi:hypothetical protein
MTADGRRWPPIKSRQFQPQIRHEIPFCTHHSAFIIVFPATETHGSTRKSKLSAYAPHLGIESRHLPCRHLASHHRAASMLRRTVGLTIVSTAFLLAATGTYGEECVPVDNSVTYVRKHVVGNYRNEPVRTEDDELSIARHPNGKVEFCLNVVDTNNHVCSVSGELTQQTQGSLMFTSSNGECSLEFRPVKSGYRLIASPKWDRFGSCQKMHCGMYASVKSGLFRKSK